MEDREFSSPVCYLDLDALQPRTTEKAEAGLCEICKAVLAAFESIRPASQWISIVYASSEALNYSKNTDCRLCVLLSNNLTPPAEDKPSTKLPGVVDHIKTRVIYRLGSTALRREFLEFEVSSPDDPALSYEATFEVLLPSTRIDISTPADDDPKPGKLLRRPTFNGRDLGTSTSASLDLAATWLKDCITDHPNCHTETNFYPTRLIDIGLGSTPTPSLVAGSDLAAGSKYVTLSHCWGRFMPRKLLRDNYTSTRKGFQLEELPKTFQDALVVTQRLGQRYIWIDSLCIIQDDMADWRRESARMGKIYRKSLCNISATAAKDGSEGLFFDRCPLPMPEFQFSGSKAENKGPFYLWKEDAWDEAVEDAPLNQRGWVCQERFLSPCNLHFASKQLFWECCHTSACEVFPRGFPDGLGPEDSSSKKHFSHAMTSASAMAAVPLQDTQLQSLHYWYESWTDLVGIYSKGGLTIERDKLVAISGLAAVWAQMNQDTYLAGLWRKDLPSQLLWRRGDDYLEEYRERQYTAPSWSWAALDGPIEYNKQLLSEDDESSYLIDVLDCGTELVGKDPYGQVKSGFLKLRSPLALGELSSAVEHPGPLQVRTSAQTTEVCRGVIWDFGGRPAVQASRSSTADRVLDPRIVYLMPIMNSGLTEGLVLAATGNVGQFVRVGLFEYWDSSMDMLDQACKYFDTVSMDSGLEQCEDGKFGSKYTISLI